MSAKKSFYPGDIPAKPGVYVFRDRFGKVIYVGKAANLRHRMSQYFQPSRKNTADPKQRSLINSIDKWEFFTVKNEDESLILESRLIKQYAPRYNVLMRDDKRYFLIKINPNEKFPKLNLARMHKDDGCRYFGPFPKSGVLKPTVDFLNRYFKIRTCRAAEPGEMERKHCLASRIRDCCEPCIGKVSPEEYRLRVESMIKVLEGSTGEVMEELKKRMNEAAGNRNFEKAAQWRDMISNISEVFGSRLRSFRFASLPTESGEEAVKDLQKALGIEKEPETIEAFDISNIGGKFAVASMVCFRKGKPDKKEYRRFRIKGKDEPDDFAMMKEAVKRRYSARLEEKKPLPGLILIDGGKGQLSSALEALLEIKCPPLPIIGLAKKNEEIFLPGRNTPLVLEKHRAALKLLQAVRDESHRFAVQYHRKLRSKRLQESLLDEIPGIGAERKKAILSAFGSVARFRKAGAKEISEKVPGIGDKFAETLHKHLERRQ